MNAAHSYRLHSCRLHMERVDDTRNMARFYQLAIETTLFGDFAVVRNWGRMGSHGQSKTHIVETEKQALELLLAVLRSKRARGYVPASRTPSGEYGNSIFKSELPDGGKQGI